jgi:hypothetical protein
MKIILYWRKPDMIPPNLLVARQERCEEVLMMAQALVITGAHDAPSHTLHTAHCTLHTAHCTQIASPFRVESQIDRSHSDSFTQSLIRSH